MPIAFTSEEKEKIHEKLLKVARTFAKEQPVSKITINQVTQAVGISKGAFYLFYDSKEALFYELFRILHGEIIEPVIGILDRNDLSPAEKLTQSIVAGCKALDESGMEDFFIKEVPVLVQKIPVGKKQPQHNHEQEMFEMFIRESGELAISTEAAVAAMKGLIITAYQRKSIGDSFEQVIGWMAEGICNHVFR